MEDRIKIGYTDFNGVIVPLTISIRNQVHMNICGNSGSGKSYFCLFLLNQLQKYATDIYIADYKNTGDYEQITSDYAVGADCVTLFQKYYERYQAIKLGEEKGRIWFVWDEMAGNLLWLEGQDKKLVQDIKSKMGEILMMGRALAGGAAGLVTVLQRPDSNNYSSGSRENYHVKILLGMSSVESRKMMGFLSDEIPKDFKAGVGKGLVMTDENPFPVAFTVPQIDKDKLTKLLQKKGTMKML